MLKCVIPFGGSLFLPAPHDDVPIFLKNVGGKPVLGWALSHIDGVQEGHEYISVAERVLLDKYSIDKVLGFYTARPTHALALHQPAQGLPCALLLAIEMIGDDEEVIVSAVDQFVDVDFNEVLHAFRSSDAMAGIVTFESIHPKWSYARIGSDRSVAEVQEKTPISKNALASTYWFRNASVMFEAIMAHIRRGRRVNGRFFLAPCLNELVLRGHRVMSFPIDSTRYFNFYDQQQLADFAAYLGSRARESQVRLVTLTQQYASRFDKRDLMGIEPMLDAEVTLLDSPAPRVVGKNRVIEHLRLMFAKHPRLTFTPKRVCGVAEDTTMIEFDLVLGGTLFSGVDLLRWRSGRIVEVRAYLHRSGQDSA